MKQTQRDRILGDLSDGQWRCGSYWLANYLYVYSQRVSEINHAEPGRIATRPCHQHDHPVYEYRDMTVRPAQLSLEMAGAA